MTACGDAPKVARNQEQRTLKMKKPCGIYEHGLLVSVLAYSRFPEAKVCGSRAEPEPLSFDGLVRVPARDQIVHFLILPGERQP